MLLTTALAPFFSHNSRVRGDEYAAAGAVSIAVSGPAHVVALVQGASAYEVQITRETRADGDVFVVSCECPHFFDHDAACKHIWATLFVAETRDLFGPVADAPNRTRLELAGIADIDTLDLGFDPEEFLAHKIAARLQPPAAQPASPARQFLSTLEARLHGASDTSTRPTYRYATGELMYVIEPIAGGNGRDVVISLLSRKRKQNGQWGKPQPARINAAEAALAPDADRAVLVPMIGGNSLGSPQGFYGFGGFEASAFQITDALAGAVIPAAAATGRLFMRAAQTNEPLPLTWDADPSAWTFDLNVASGHAGLVVTGSLRRGDESVQLDRATLIGGGFVSVDGRVARLVTRSGADVPLLLSLGNRPQLEIPEQDVGRLAVTFAKAGVPASTLPEALRFQEITGPPINRLRLQSQKGWSRTELLAHLEFDYSGTILDAEGPPVVVDASTRKAVRRDVTGEAAARARLEDFGLRGVYDYQARRMQLGISGTQLPRVVHALVSEGWCVEADGRAWRAASTVRMSVSSGIDWFDLSATVDFGGASAALPDVITAMRRGENTVLLGDGTMGVLPEEWLRRYSTLVAAGERMSDGQLRFRSSQAALLDALLEAQAQTTAIDLDEGFRRARQALEELDRLSAVEAPASFHGVLRDYQREALGWFQFLRRAGFGGCLADDMGLGKTVMVLALLESIRAGADAGEVPRRPSVIVVPRSLVRNWIDEAARFAPSLHVIDYSGAGRADQRAAITGAADVVLITYGTLRQDVAHLKDIEFEYVILDEAQSIKNAATSSAKAARLLRSQHRLALTGTPIENHLGELWSLFDFLNPGLLGASTIFQRAAGKTQPDEAMMSLIARALRPFILRRTKQQVARELPERTEQTILCDLDPPARALYDGLRRQYRESLLKRIDRDGIGKSKLHVLEALLRLRQAACHPRLLRPKHESGSSAKFDVLLPRLREVLAEGHKALVFSQFTSLLALLRESLDREGLVYEYLDGKTRDRATRVERFQNDPAVPLFLISLKAGGLGLNLTAAEYVFLLDPWWNPAVENQAIDRAHRIGQSREVFACRLIARDTVEEKVLELQRSKRALADAVLSANAVGLKQLAREDLELLLS